MIAMRSPGKALTTNWKELGRVWTDWNEYELGNSKTKNSGAGLLLWGKNYLFVFSYLWFIGCVVGLWKFYNNSRMK